MAAQHDVIVIGSGAGGGSVAYKLVNAGKRVLLLEKGPFLPRNASTPGQLLHICPGVKINLVAFKFFSRVSEKY